MKFKKLIFTAILTAVVGISSSVVLAADNTVYQVDKSDISPVSISGTELNTRVTTLADGGAEIGDFTAGGLLTSIGLQAGDVVLRVNGLLIDSNLSFADAVCQEVNAQAMTTLVLEVSRSGENISIYCSVGS